MVRRREELADIPAVALTAYSMPGDREDLLGKGFDGYVGKPFTRRELVEAIDQNLEQGAGRQGRGEGSAPVQVGREQAGCFTIAGPII